LTRIREIKVGKGKEEDKKETLRKAVIQKLNEKKDDVTTISKMNCYQKRHQSYRKRKQN
jgi:hypothetical protein